MLATYGFHEAFDFGYPNLGVAAMMSALPVQMAQLRQDPPESLETAIVIELPINEGFALLRAFVADDTRLAAATTALETADCSGTLDD